jgi:hypothetical protein
MQTRLEKTIRLAFEKLVIEILLEGPFPHRNVHTSNLIPERSKFEIASSFYPCDISQCMHKAVIVRHCSRTYNLCKTLYEGRALLTTFCSCCTYCKNPKKYRILGKQGTGVEKRGGKACYEGVEDRGLYWKFTEVGIDED